MAKKWSNKMAKKWPKNDQKNPRSVRVKINSEIFLKTFLKNSKKNAKKNRFFKLCNQAPNSESSTSVRYVSFDDFKFSSFSSNERLQSSSSSSVSRRICSTPDTKDFRPVPRRLTALWIFKIIHVIIHKLWLISYDS